MNLSHKRSSYKQAFLISLLLNAVLVIAAIGGLLATPASAISLEVVGSTEDSTSYQLDMGETDVVYVICGNSGAEAVLGYLSNAQALTCPA